MKKIVLSNNVKAPSELFDVIISNEEFIKKALNNNVILSDLHQDSVICYYLDHFDEIVAFNGFKAFFFKTRNASVVKEKVKEALTRLGLEKHLEIFEEYEKMIAPYNTKDIYSLEGNMPISFSELDLAYRDLDEDVLENAIGDFLINHKDAIFYTEVEQDNYIKDIIKDVNVEEMLHRQKEYLNMMPSYAKYITLICNTMNKQLASISDALIKMFDFNNHVFIYFETTDNTQYSYIDLGSEVVLCNSEDEEIRRYSKKKLGENYE